MFDPRLELAEPPEDEEESKSPDRSRDLLGRSNSPIRRKLDKLFGDIVKGFEDQAARSDDLDNWWNCYNCVLDENQFYNGNAEIYVPIIRDAINARKTRFRNQLFPASGRYIDCTASDGGEPYEILALLNHYIRSARLKTQVIDPLLVNGDIEGHYNLYIDWTEVGRLIVEKKKRGTQVPMGGQMVEAPGDEYDDVTEEEIVEGRPSFEVLHDSDVLVLPQNADSIEEALQRGGAVVVVRRWTKNDIDSMAAANEIRSDEIEELKEINVVDPKLPGISNDLGKELIKAVGIKPKGPHAIVLETWTMLPLNENGAYAEKGEKRLCRVWFGCNRKQLGAKRNPYWNDRCPLLSWPNEKVAGVFKGKSRVEPLAPLQWEANDAANERADVDHYGSMPIIVRKPGEGNGPLVLNLAAVWDIDPASIKFAEFPDLSERAMSRIMAATTAIFQSLGVNPAMLPQQSGKPGAKRNQAEVSMEQAVDLLTTAEAVASIAEGLDEAAAWMVDLDHQFRDRELTVRKYGEFGIMAEMMDVPPLQNRSRYQFEWCGAEQARLNLAMQQQGTALINVARGVAQQLQQEGYELRLGPALERAFVNVFGPMTGRLMLVDKRRQMTVDAKLENKLMAEGHHVMIHKLDNDAEHLKLHYPEQQVTGDPHGNIRMHIEAHIVQMNAKNQAQIQAMMGGRMGLGAPGVPGGAGPGVAGTPRPGGVPTAPRAMQGPPGMVRPDQMPRMGGGSVMPFPRKT